MADPLVVTLALDAASQDFFEAARRAHFPPGRNMIPAHLTLFHALPGDRLEEVRARLAEAAATTPPLPFRCAEVMAMGRGGTAYRLEMPGAKALKKRLMAAMDFELSPQDRQGLSPHVTVQNKVGREEANAAREALRAMLEPFEGRAEALMLWHYRGGPWEAEARLGLSGTDAPRA
jgi:2'-5' RNA ligase